jgi:hypothetical protein
LPTIIQGLGVKSAFAIGLLSAVLYIGFIITMLLVGRLYLRGCGQEPRYPTELVHIALRQRYSAE